MITSITYRWLAERLGCETQHNELKKALTHKSFYEYENHEGTNSRYIFLGMFGFKGQVAETLYNYMPGTGTQLQHYLGNIFKDETLLKIYQNHHLDVLCRYGSSFDIMNQKHVMVYGFLGFVANSLDQEHLNKFIVRNFLDNTGHLMPVQFNNRDLQSQCNYFAKLKYNKPAVLLTIKAENLLFRSQISVNGDTLAIAESKSYKYSRKKARKLALLALSAPMRAKIHDDPAYLELEEKLKLRDEEEKQQIKEEKARKYTERQEKRKKIRLEKREKTKAEAAEKEIARRKAKAKAKARAEARAKAEAEKKASMANISVAKRRHLQDKQK